MSKENQININTLKELANKSDTFWKFSQTEKGKSIETVFAEYKENQITIAADPDKALSFTNSANIAKCFWYGDQLTKLCFEKNNPLFKQIQNTPYRCLGTPLGEYETKKLVVEKNYSLKLKSTIRLLVELLPSGEFVHRSTCWFGYNHPFEDRLRKLGFNDSANLINVIQQYVNRDIHLTKEDTLKIIDNYKEF